MKNIFIALLTVIAITAGLVIVLPKGNTNQVNDEISLSQIDKNINSGALLIDVRSAKEYNLNHAVNSINLPVEDIKLGKMPTDYKNKLIYVYCRSGKRASDAKALLTNRGYNHVISIISLKNWISLGGKTIDSSGKTCSSKDEKAC